MYTDLWGYKEWLAILVIEKSDSIKLLKSDPNWVVHSLERA